MIVSIVVIEEYIYYFLMILKYNGKGVFINKYVFIIMFNYGVNNNLIV